MPSPAKTLRAWYMYDWANSVYSLVITSTIFPIYYGAVTRGADGQGLVPFLGSTWKASVLFSYALSLAFLLVALVNPLLSAIADHGGSKKKFLQGFCYLGAASCAALFFFTEDTLALGLCAFVLATMGFTGSLVFYNAFLPEIAPKERMDAASATGFAYGYVGSVILLIINLLPILKPEWFGGVSAGMASRISFVCTGLWWAGFAQITFAGLSDTPPSEPKTRERGWLLSGFRELKAVAQELRLSPLLPSFLLAFFFYNMGVQTVMYLATLFGDKELKLPAESLIIIILLLQILAIVGARLCAWLSARLGNFRALAWIVLVWIGVCFGAYFVYSASQFYLLASVVGLVMGGVQSLSRSTWAKLIPEHSSRPASYFSFFDAVDKLGIVLGTASYGLVEALTGSMRNSSLALAVYFVLGLGALLLLGRHTRPAQGHEIR